MSRPEQVIVGGLRGTLFGWEVVTNGGDPHPVGRQLARELVARLSAVDATAVSIVANCPDCERGHGKPMVTSPEGFSVSIAHARGLVVALARRGTASVGIDVEPTIGSEERARAIRQLTGFTGADALRHWTRVEAILKADGRGLRVDPARVVVRGTRGRLIGESARFRLLEPAAIDGMLVSIAVRTH